MHIKINFPFSPAAAAPAHAHGRHAHGAFSKMPLKCPVHFRAPKKRNASKRFAGGILWQECTDAAYGMLKSSKAAKSSFAA